MYYSYYVYIITVIYRYMFNYTQATNAYALVEALTFTCMYYIITVYVFDYTQATNTHTQVEAYLNLPEVQEALHANQSVHMQPGPWTDCTRGVSMRARVVAPHVLLCMRARGGSRHDHGLIARKHVTLRDEKGFCLC